MVEHLQDDSGQPPTSQQVTFTGDYVRLAGQMDYPSSDMPSDGYPLLFIIQHATCTSRDSFAHIVKLGNELGAAVFRWDKRGTGKSGASSNGTVFQDTVRAYQTALMQPKIDPQRAVIVAQNEGGLLLGENVRIFTDIQMPVGVLLLGNMLDAGRIIDLRMPVHIVMSKNDWNAWQIYGDEASQAHRKRTKQATQYYVAPNTNRHLLYTNGGTFHQGAAQSIRIWLEDVCQISAST